MSGAPSQYRVWIYLIALAGFLLVLLFAYEFFYRYPIWTLRAFRVPSKSMCPTICSGERILVHVQNGIAYIPHRGDVIAFRYQPDAIFLKRVIGLPGDVVAPGPNDTILVNGQPWQPPPVCAKSLLANDSNHVTVQYSTFKETRVPPNQLFVIGDNLTNSFDSRIGTFEPVTTDKIIGLPVLIYWSPESSRIGCPIR